MLRIDDDEQLHEGWHSFILRWEHEKPFWNCSSMENWLSPSPTTLRRGQFDLQQKLALVLGPQNGQSTTSKLVSLVGKPQKKPFEDKEVNREVAGLSSLNGCTDEEDR
jgi:hypothetical protein